MKLKNSHLTASVILLLCLYLLSFLNFGNASRKAFKTALLNPKYKNEVTGFKLSKGDESVFLEKKNNFWFVKSSENSSNSVPADSDLIENLINELIKIRKLYKISDKLSVNNHFGFDYSSKFYIKCSYNGNFTDFYFGNQDFSEVFRYFMTGKNTKVYQIDSSFEPYLTSLESFWSEKTIISKKLLNISSNQDIQSVVVNSKRIDASSADKSFVSYTQTLLELRHGGILDTDSAFFSKLLTHPPEAQIFIELGNKNSLSLKVYKSSEKNAVENEYVLIVNYENLNLKAVYKISGWTLSKLLQNKAN